MEFVIPPARHGNLDSDAAGGEPRGLMSDYAPGASAMTLVMMMMNLWRRLSVRGVPVCRHRCLSFRWERGAATLCISRRKTWAEWRHGLALCHLLRNVSRLSSLMSRQETYGVVKAVASDKKRQYKKDTRNDRWSITKRDGSNESDDSRLTTDWLLTILSLLLFYFSFLFFLITTFNLIDRLEESWRIVRICKSCPDFR